MMFGDFKSKIKPEFSLFTKSFFKKKVFISCYVVTGDSKNDIEYFESVVLTLRAMPTTKYQFREIERSISEQVLLSRPDNETANVTIVSIQHIKYGVAELLLESQHWKAMFALWISERLKRKK